MTSGAMKKNAYRYNVSLIDIAKSGAVGPIRVGSNISDIGDILGPPRYWGFPGFEAFDAYMGFGGVEIGFQLKDELIKVEYIKFNLCNNKREVMPFCKGGRYDARISIVIPSKSDREYDRVKSELLSKEIKFSELLDAPVTDETFAMISFRTGVRFYFSKSKGNPLETVALTDISLYKDSPFNIP